MARKRIARGNRGRGGNRGGLYSRPIPEPSNFVEFEIPITDTDNVLTYTDVFTALTAKVPGTSIDKFRVSSLVVDPIVGAGLVPYFLLDMGASGNHFQSTSNNRPLRVRLGKDYGDDGQWIHVNESDGTMVDNPGVAASSTFAGVSVPGSSTWNTNLHLRVAYTDPT